MFDETKHPGDACDCGTLIGLLASGYAADEVLAAYPGTLWITARFYRGDFSSVKSGPTWSAILAGLAHHNYSKQKSNSGSDV